MNRLHVCLNVYLSSLLILSLSSCSAPPPSIGESPAPSSSSPLPSSSSLSVSPSSPSHALAPEKTTTINIYKVDGQCAMLMPEKTTVAVTRSLQDAIAKVLAETDSGDFSIAGYRVSVDNGRAIVDLRLPANSQRQFRSLSSCEQLALFGGIRKTLINNSQWKIQSVQFTEKGKEIVL